MINRLVSYTAMAVALGTSIVPLSAQVGFEDEGQVTNLNRSVVELTNSQRFDFADLSYKANKKDQSIFEERVKSLENKGWEVKKVDGTTGFAQDQVESTMAIMAFNGKKVVIATRGTVTASDWITDFRFARNPLATIFGNAQENTKDELIAGQFLGLKEGKVHNGFLQTHLSMYSQVQKELLDHANRIGCASSDLEIETVGHSLGAAQEDLMAAHLLMDSRLGIGTQILEKSFIDQDDDLGMSSFYALKRTEAKENTSIRGLGIETPRAFSTEAAKEVDQRLGKGAITHIQNGWDLVPHVPPTFIGFDDIGDKVYIDSGHNPISAHFMGNVRGPALEALNERESQQSPSPKKVIEEQAEKETKSLWSRAKSFGSSVINKVQNFGRSVLSFFGF